MALFTKQHDNEDYIVLAMFLMVSSDASIDDREIIGVKHILGSLPRFSGFDIDNGMLDAKTFIIENGFKNSFDKFKQIRSEDLKKTVLILAIEASMLDHIITDSEEDVIVDLAHSMGLSDETLEQAIDVISWKYSLDDH